MYKKLTANKMEDKSVNRREGEWHLSS